MKYFKSRCHICFEVTDCRNVNIYHIGSEGLDMCDKCMKDLLHYIEDQKGIFQDIRKQKYINLT